MFYFAKFVGNYNEIIIFKTKEDRDNWVNFKDEFSRDMGTTSENALFQRVALSPERAIVIAGDSFNRKDNYYIDEISGYVVLFCKPRVCREVEEEQRYKIVLDLFSEITAQTVCIN